MVINPQLGLKEEDITGTVGIIRDITEQKRTDETMGLLISNLI